MSNENSLALNIVLKEKHLEIFNRVKRQFGFESNAETLRFILVKFGEFYFKEEKYEDKKGDKPK